MTSEQAQWRVQEILNALARKGLTPGGRGDFMLSGGNLKAEVQGAENPDNWTVIWRPNDDGLMPLDLGEFSVEMAARQVQRYGHRGYTDVRRRFEAFLMALVAAPLFPIESHSTPDAIELATGTLSIIDVSGGSRPQYSIEFESDTVIKDIVRGEATKNPHAIDVSDYSVDAVLELGKVDRKQ